MDEQERVELRPRFSEFDCVMTDKYDTELLFLHSVIIYETQMKQKRNKSCEQHQILLPGKVGR